MFSRGEREGVDGSPASLPPAVAPWSPRKWIGVLAGAAAVLFAQWFVLAMLALAKVDGDYQAQGITDGGGVDGDTHAFVLSILWWCLLVAVEVVVVVTITAIRRRRRRRRFG